MSVQLRQMGIATLTGGKVVWRNYPVTAAGDKTAVEGKNMNGSKNTSVSPAGSINKSGVETVIWNGIEECGMESFINRYFDDSSKGPAVVKYIDQRFGGDLNSAISVLFKQPGTKDVATALSEYQAYVKELSRARMEANRPVRKSRKDPVPRKVSSCEICGQVNEGCREDVVEGTTLIVCPGCREFAGERKPELRKEDKLQYWIEHAGLTGCKVEPGTDNMPTFDVVLERGLPQHPVSYILVKGNVEELKAKVRNVHSITAEKGDIRMVVDTTALNDVKKKIISAGGSIVKIWRNYRIIVPNITNEQKKLLKDADKATVRMIGMFGNQFIKVRIMSAHKREMPTAPEKKSFYARIFYRNGNIHIESATVKKRISIPRENREEIFSKKDLWGMWKMEVIREKEHEDFVFAKPLQKVEEKEVPDQEMPNVFYATVKIFDGGLSISSDTKKDKRITIPRDSIPRLRYKLGVWKMRVITEGDDYIFSKPIEHIDNKGIGRNELAARLNQLQQNGRVEL
jgi:hypothetical protein